MTKNKFIIRSERLGFRTWKRSDLKALAEMNADPVVMEHFPKTLTIAESENQLERLTRQYEEKSYTYFAVETLTDGEFIGFICLTHQNYDSPYTPATDIGWRLKRSAWGQGYATEGAKRCLHFAFEVLDLDQVIATCTVGNHRSENVMKKIGMKKNGEFNHPALIEHPEYEKCFCYYIHQDEWNNDQGHNTLSS